MKNILSLLVFCYFTNTPMAFSQGKAMEYLNNAPKPPVEPCACTKAIYKKYEAVMNAYCDKIQADMNARESQSTKNKLAGNKEYMELFEKTINANQVLASKYYCLDNTCDEYPNLLNETERSTVLKDIQICTSVVQNQMDIILHRTSGKTDPESENQINKAKAEYCGIMSVKYLMVLDEYRNTLIRLFPSYERMGELEYSSPSAKEIPMLNAVRAFLSKYPSRYYCGNLNIR